MFNFFPNEQTLLNINIGSITLSVRWYAFLILTGALIACGVSRNEAKKAKYINMDFFDSLLLYAIWVGVIGSRLWYCAFIGNTYYFKNPGAIIRIWDGGLAIQGAVVAALIFGYFYCKKYKYSFFKITDIILPNVLIGQAIGRWGNFINRECHGGMVDEAYFDGILSFLKEGMCINGTYYEPLFFFESMLCIIGWVIIFFGLRKNQNKRGDLTYAYLMWYGVVRFFIEGRRTDSLLLGSLKMAQVTSVIYLIIGLLGYFGVLDKVFKKEKPTIIFDMDGTLIDTTESIVGAYRALFEKYGDVKDFDEEKQKEVIGPPLRELFPKYFPGIDIDTLFADYRAAQTVIAKKVNKPMPNVPEVLKTLHEQGYNIAVVSTRLHDKIYELLQDFNLEGYVDYICGLEDTPNGKPSPEPIFKVVNDNNWNKECVIIGDTMLDVGAGKNYGAYTVAYISDPIREEELSKNANETIHDMIEVLDVLKKNISFTYTKL